MTPSAVLGRETGEHRLLGDDAVVIADFFWRVWAGRNREVTGR